MRTIFSAVLLSVLVSQPISGLVAPLRSRGNIVLTNDDGWATAQLRSEYSALKAAGFNVVLSAPATDQSGTGSSSAAPTQLNTTCEFDTCPKGSPFTGHEPFDLNINYYNAFPADSVRFGIQTLSPRLLGSKPMLVVSGTNIGTNLGDVVMISGTVGAATEAALEGIPSIAFSGDSGDFVSYTKLVTDPHSSAVIAANIYTELVIKFVDALLSGPGSEILPSDVSLNVNFPSIKKCPSANSFSFALTRILKNTGNSNDVEICGNKVLPNEDSVFGKDCFITVSPFHVPTKTDVDASTQEFVLQKLGSILSCPH